MSRFKPDFEIVGDGFSSASYFIKKEEPRIKIPLVTPALSVLQAHSLRSSRCLQCRSLYDPSSGDEYQFPLRCSGLRYSQETGINSVLKPVVSAKISRPTIVEAMQQKDEGGSPVVRCEPKFKCR